MGIVLLMKGVFNRVVNHFESIFSTSRDSRDINWTHFMNHICNNLSPTTIHILNESFSALEIKDAIFQMEPSKAPGPDGFSALFYQKFWNVVEEEVTQQILKMLNPAKLEENINDTMITLIPKQARPLTVSDFRPISLCNVSSKIISKVLANRLKLVLPEVISENQSAFMEGRMITDNFILAHELSHFIKSRRNQKEGYFSLKTDMSKAYDRVEWDFLEIMLNLGFPPNWVRLIMECITSVSYRVKFNDVITDSFQPKRGLRQGDPLSPYLFLVCGEWLSSTLSHMVSLRNLHGIRICRDAPVISHLFFAEDSILFPKPNFRNILVLKRALDDYQQVSGQCINFSKSEVVFSRNVSVMIKNFF